MNAPKWKILSYPFPFCPQMYPFKSYLLSFVSARTNKSHHHHYNLIVSPCTPSHPLVRDCTYSRFAVCCKGLLYLDPKPRTRNLINCAILLPQTGSWGCTCYTAEDRLHACMYVLMYACTHKQIARNTLRFKHKA